LLGLPILELVKRLAEMICSREVEAAAIGPRACLRAAQECSRLDFDSVVVRPQPSRLSAHQVADCSLSLAIDRGLSGSCHPLAK
jgi:hypothetical protein